MDLRNMLMAEHSRGQMLRIAAYISKDPERFDELIRIFTEGNYRLTQRASWPLTYCVGKYPALLNSHLPILLDLLEKPHHDAVTRNIVRLLQFVDIPDAFSGRVMNICFDLVMKPKEKVAPKAFALTVLAALAKRYPEIKNEILLCIETQLPDASPGFRSRARRVADQLRATGRSEDSQV